MLRAAIKKPVRTAGTASKTTNASGRAAAAVMLAAPFNPPAPPKPGAPAPRPVDALANPAPWTPTLDASGIADDADLTNRYNQDKSSLDTQWGDQQAKFTRDYTTAAEAFAARNKSIANNAAARGMGHSGIQAQNDLESGQDYTRNVNDLDTARKASETTYKDALKNLATNYQNALLRNSLTSGQRSLTAYNQSTAGAYDAPTPAGAPGTGIKMSWAEFLKKHPSANTPARVTALRQKYQRWVNG